VIDSSAHLPPVLPGLDSRWSRIVSIPDHDGAPIDIHVLDAGPRDADLSVVCVHGNPTWSYLWRHMFNSAPANVRVIAIDQVSMGYSARSKHSRRLRDRIDDLDAIIRALDIRGSVAVVAHDWGGPISLGWVQRTIHSREFSVSSVVLMNTAVHQPEHRGAPRVISAARLPGVLDILTQKTSGFVRATTAISAMDPQSAQALRAPYARSLDRAAIRDFVADIPLHDDHPSRSDLEAVAEGLTQLQDLRILLVWGMRDPVFSARYLDDLRRRLPQAQVQQYDDAGHLVIEDRPDCVDDIWEWLVDIPTEVSQRDQDTSIELLAGLRRRAGRDALSIAVTQPRAESWRHVTWQQLDARVQSLASGFRQRGVRAGDRVALLIPPGADLLAVVYAVWSVGATIVVIDAAQGVRPMWRALRAARLDHVVAIRRARPVVFALRVPGAVIWVDELKPLADQGGEEREESATDSSWDAAIVFTSGATGPAKAVAYTRERIAATRDILVSHYGFTERDVLVAAFAPWAVLGPLLGISSVIPRMDASRPGTLTSDSLAEAMEEAGGTVMWMSPAALRSVLAGARPGTPSRVRLAKAGSNLRLLLIAGAPVSRHLLSEAMDVWPDADVRTPYGMTEVLPATDVQAREVLGSGTELGVLVGRPLPLVDIAIARLNHVGQPADELITTPGVLGEVAVRARHAKSRYDGRVFVERKASRNPGWHRTGDIGILDEHGRLWIQGRLSHVITSADGPRGPVSIEQRAETAVADQGILTAAVGVGSPGNQVIVLICAPPTPTRSRSAITLADAQLTEKIRAEIPGVAAVLWRSRMPVDIRHGAKIDRQLLAEEADRFLAGRS
jgi:acyl-coenzyme A synthetase/AMP-(fatty) acid ligase/pimeloyl-ACP methyl ester carboxylesterase